MSDEEQRKLMASWALGEVKKYNYPKIIDQYEAAYKEAVAIKNKSKLVGNDAKKRRKIIHRLFVRRQAW